MTVQIAKRRFTVDEYYAMTRAGILSEDDRVELIDGEIVEIHRSPTVLGYEQVQTLSGTDRVAPLAFPQLELAVHQMII